jgi:phosphoribosylformimino-5-aminoimidazole carboxamide ribotide isomerase
MRIVPAIDLIEGQPVRLKQGDFKQQQFYPESLMELAAKLWDSGIRNLHLVDLSAAQAEHLGSLKALEELLVKFPFCVDYGGGIRSKEQVQRLFSLGVDAVNIGTLIFSDRTAFNELLAEYPAKIIASLDVKNNRIAYRAWQESSAYQIADLLPDLQLQGLQKLCVTDIEKDGMLAGPSLALYQALKQEYPNLDLIASGGVRDRKDIMALEKIPCEAVIIGKAWLNGNLNLLELC